MRLTTLHTLILTLLASLLLHSQLARANPTAELYQASGMNQHQQHFQLILNATQQRYQQQLPPGLYERLVRQSSQRFEPQGMHDRAQARLALAVNEEDHRQALVFYNSELGRKIVNAETRATSPATVAALSNGLPEQNISPERRTMMNQLSQQLPALELGVEVSMALANLATQSANDLLGGLMQVPESMVSGRRNTLRAQMQPNLPDTLAHVYKDLSDEELTRYVNWSESEQGERFYRAVEMAARDALNP